MKDKKVVSYGNAKQLFLYNTEYHYACVDTYVYNLKFVVRTYDICMIYCIQFHCCMCLCTLHACVVLEDD